MYAWFGLQHVDQLQFNKSALGNIFISYSGELKEISGNLFMDVS